MTTEQYGEDWPSSSHMLLTTIDNLVIASGYVDTWTISARGAAQPSPIGPSENERFHLDSVRGGGIGWLALTIELPGHHPPEAFTDAFGALLERHEVLRGHFAVTDGSDDAEAVDYQRFIYEPGTSLLENVSRTFFNDSTIAGAPAFRSAIDTTCTPFQPYPHFFATVEHRESTTVVCAFDHCFVDAISVAIVAEDLLHHFRGIAVPAAGSFLSSGGARVPQPSRVDDPRLTPWHTLLSATDWSVPEFPLDLGVAEGDKVPSHIDVREVFDAATAHLFDVAAREHGLRTYPTMLACLAIAIQRSGGPDKTAMIIPVHTRRHPDRERAVGWFVSNGPLLVDGAESDLFCASHKAIESLTAAVLAADVGISSVYGAFGDRIHTRRSDIFMVSYVDYRRFDLPESVSPKHVSSSGKTDTLQLWFWRDESGLHLRARYPATTIARTTVPTVLQTLIELARSVIAVARAGHQIR
ncbi:condensation protein [Williamsia sp. 1138]|uniref:condensation domain-containing protein n=1 Tax=Williamsia sp. 1138 TaxID=1903117 RepID=UPI000A120A73|nr:condensation domain-containing protein [Williamsia sp. 1138]OZG26932.1 condensation protein [Williamsia sp. 1138]